jgi:hypothetical protein
VNEHDAPHPAAYQADNRALCDWLVQQLDRLVERRAAVERAAHRLSELELAAHRRSLVADHRRLLDELERGMAARGIRSAA